MGPEFAELREKLRGQQVALRQQITTGKFLSVFPFNNELIHRCFMAEDPTMMM